MFLAINFLDKKKFFRTFGKIPIDWKNKNSVFQKGKTNICSILAYVKFGVKFHSPIFGNSCSPFGRKLNRKSGNYVFPPYLTVAISSSHFFKKNFF